MYVCMYVLLPLIPVSKAFKLLRGKKQLEFFATFTPGWYSPCITGYPGLHLSNCYYGLPVAICTQQKREAHENQAPCPKKSIATLSKA